MARTAITRQSPSETGAALTLEAANVDGNSVSLAGTVLLWVKNASVSSVTLTLPTPGTVQGLAIAERTVAVPAAEERIIRLGEVLRQANNTVNIDYSAVTSVTVAALTL